MGLVALSATLAPLPGAEARFPPSAPLAAIERPAEGDEAGVVEIADVVVSETTGPSTRAVFELTLVEPHAQGIELAYATRPVEADADVDYVSSSGTVAFAPGDRTAPLPVTVVGDDVDEDAETFILEVASVEQQSVLAQATATIVDDDEPPAISVLDSSTHEGFAGAHLIPLRLERASGRWTHVYCRTHDGTALAGADYQPRVDQPVQPCAAVAPGDRTAGIPVELLPDLAPEDDESFSIELTRALGAGIADRSATVSILDDDAVELSRPTLSVTDAIVSESRGRVLVWVRLSRPTVSPVNFRFSTVPDTASTDDVVAREGTYSLYSGASQVGFVVELARDRLHEDDEAFHLEVTGVTGADVARSRGTVAIVDDDPPPIVEVDDAWVAEGDDGEAVAGIPVRLTTVSARPVEVSYELTEEAAPGLEPSRRHGTVVIGPGATTASIPVPIAGDTRQEPDATWSVAIAAATHAMLGRSTATLIVVDDDAQASGPMMSWA